MAFRLGNHSIDEILYGVAQNFSDELLYTLDQLSSAEIAIEAESTDITDKKGNVVRTVYRSKSGTLTATNAFLHPAVMNAASGSDIEVATAANKIRMPKIATIAAGASLDVGDALEGTIHVMGLYNNGANGVELAQGTAAVVDTSYALVDGTLTVPAAATDAPTSYVIRYERDVASGIKLINSADKFPNTVRLTLLCTYVDPCDDTLKPCYVYIPSFMADPSVTISLDAENQEMTYNGNLQMDYCSGVTKTLYIIYYPDEDVTVVGQVATDNDANDDDINNLFDGGNGNGNGNG